jgi:hypothetical protein
MAMMQAVKKPPVYTGREFAPHVPLEQADEYISQLYGVLRDFEQDVEDGATEGSWQEIEQRRLSLWRDILGAEAARRRHAGNPHGGTYENTRRTMLPEERLQAYSGHQRVALLRQMAPYLRGMPENLRDELYYLLQGDTYAGGHGGMIGLRNQAEQEAPDPAALYALHDQNAARWGQRDWQQLYFGSPLEQRTAGRDALRRAGYPLDDEAINERLLNQP